MANEPKKAKEHRSPPPRQENDQGDHEGSAHRPEEFDALNPARDPEIRKETPGKR